MEQRSLKFTLTSCVVMPTYILLQFIFFKLQERSHSTIPLDVWVPRKLDREAISGCLQLPSSFSFFFNTNFVQPKAFEALMLET